MTGVWKLYKATRRSGTDFHSGTVQWAPPEGHEGEWIVRHPTSTRVGSFASEHLSVSTTPTDCTGMEWPARLFEVEPVGEITSPEPKDLPNKRAGVAFRVVREIDAHQALGPQGEHVAELLERARSLSEAEIAELDEQFRGSAKYTARRTARDAVGDTARDTAWIAAGGAVVDAVVAAVGDAAWNAVGDVAREAVWALLVRDLIDTKVYDTLTLPWRRAIGPIHPDDPAV